MRIGDIHKKVKVKRVVFASRRVSVKTYLARVILSKRATQLNLCKVCLCVSCVLSCVTEAVAVCICGVALFTTPCVLKDFVEAAGPVKIRFVMLCFVWRTII